MGRPDRPRRWSDYSRLRLVLSTVPSGRHGLFRRGSRASFPLPGLLRFIQFSPLRLLFRRKRSDYPAVVGGRKAESREQAGELSPLGPSDSACPKLRHCTDDDFHGPAVRVSCDTFWNHLSELAPYSFLFVGVRLGWTAKLLRNDRFSCSGCLPILVINERATRFQDSGRCAV